jgi:hypothetical protein
VTERTAGPSPAELGAFFTRDWIDLCMSSVRVPDSSTPGVMNRIVGSHREPHPPTFRGRKESVTMPEKKTMEKAQRDLKQGKSASTAAGEFVHEEIDHIRQGKHGARSAKQAIAIGLSKARRAGVPLATPKAGQASEGVRRSAQRDSEIGQGTRKRRPSTKRSQAMRERLKREPRAAASKTALSRQAKAAAARRRRTKATGGATADRSASTAKGSPRRSATKRRPSKRAPTRSATKRRPTRSTTRNASARRSSSSSSRRARQPNAAT